MKYALIPFIININAVIFVADNTTSKDISIYSESKKNGVKN